MKLKKYRVIVNGWTLEGTFTAKNETELKYKALQLIMKYDALKAGKKIEIKEVDF